MKSFLNTRQYDILASLLKDDGPKTVGELSNALDMHPRVIQYNLNAIDAWLESNHSRIIRRSGMGLHIDLTQQQRVEMMNQLSKLDNIELVLSTRQRRRYMLLNPLYLALVLLQFVGLRRFDPDAAQPPTESLRYG